MTPQLAQHTAERAARHWSIISQKPELFMQRENIVFRVETSLGAHALRLHRPGYHSDVVLRSELDWMVMLANAGYVVPVPAATDEGSFLLRIDGHAFSLLSWQRGAAFGKSAEPLGWTGSKRLTIMADIGRKLATLHILSDQWKPPADFKRPSWGSDGLLGESPFWGKFWHCGFVSAEDRKWLVRLREHCQRQLLNYENSGADFGLIHADLARENILVEESNVCFIDYDDSGFGYRMFDIATALIKNLYEPDYEHLKQALLEGYQAVRPMRDFDRGALPLMLLLRSLSYLGWVNDRIHEPGMRAKAERFWVDVKFMADHNGCADLLQNK